MDKIGQRIKTLRENHGYSLRQLGERISITHSHISRIEKGEKTPNIDLLESLAKVFDVSISYFFGEEMDIPEELKERDVKWIAFGEEMEKKDLTPEEIKKIVDMIDFLRNK